MTMTTREAFEKGTDKPIPVKASAPRPDSRA